ncbi:hypothetical protein ACJBU6_04964 [Exserohilum turcicum]
MEASMRKGAKRKSFEAVDQSVDMHTADANADMDEHDAQDTATGCNKKQKTKLQTHHEPVAVDTHGTKRPSPCASVSSPSTSSVSSSSSRASKRRRIMYIYHESSNTLVEKREYARVFSEFVCPPAAKKVCARPA